MKSLKNYIEEALISSKNKVKSNVGNLYKFDRNLAEKYNIDIFDSSIDMLVQDYTIEDLDKCITNVKIPIAKWYIYKDKYTYYNYIIAIRKQPGNFQQIMQIHSSTKLHHYTKQNVKYLRMAI